MAYKPAKRSFNGVQNQRTRELWDNFYNEASDAISSAYYDHWRHGNEFEITIGSGVPNTSTLNISATWTPAQIKQYWDNLQKELHHCYYGGFEFWNNTGNPVDRIPESEWNNIYQYDADGNQLPWDGSTRTNLANTELSAMEVAGTRNCKEYFSKWL